MVCFLTLSQRGEEVIAQVVGGWTASVLAGTAVDLVILVYIKGSSN
jgi:hypothetical protein